MSPLGGRAPIKSLRVQFRGWFCIMFCRGSVFVGIGKNLYWQGSWIVCVVTLFCKVMLSPEMQELQGCAPSSNTSLHR